MTVWFVIPTANPVRCSQTFEAWRRKGYRTAALTDGEYQTIENCDIRLHAGDGDYDGYAWAVNLLCALPEVAEADWIVTGGDDVLPDEDASPDDIAHQCSEHFAGTFGVMQPCGDPCDAAVSPWIGKDWRRRINGGRGPLWREYEHYFVDAELRAVAEKLGVYWMRGDITQRHEHWTRKRGGKRPAHLERWATRHDEYRRLFESRKAAGFPGHGPI